MAQSGPSIPYNTLRIFLFTLPLFFLPIGLEHFEAPKIALLWVVSILLFLLNYFFDPSFTQTLKMINKDVLARVWFAYITIAVFTTLIRGNLTRGFWGSTFRLDGLFTLLALTLLLVILIHTFRTKDFQFVLQPFVYSAILVAILGFIQWLAAQHHLISGYWLYDQRITSTLGQPNFLGGLLVTVLPLVYFKNELYCFLIKLLLVLVILLSVSKGAYLALGILAILYSLRRNPKILLITFLSSITLWYYSYTAGFLTKIYFFFERGKFYQLHRLTYWWSPTDLFADLRWSIFRASIKALRVSPLLGYGKGNIPNVMSVFAVRFADLVPYAIDSSHNLLLDIGLESGLLGLLAFSLFYVLLIFRAYKISLNLGDACLIFLVCNLVNNSFILHWVLLMIICAWVVSNKRNLILDKPAE